MAVAGSGNAEPGRGIGAFITNGSVSDTVPVRCVRDSQFNLILLRELLRRFHTIFGSLVYLASTLRHLTGFFIFICQGLSKYLMKVTPIVAEVLDSPSAASGIIRQSERKRTNAVKTFILLRVRCWPLL